MAYQAQTQFAGVSFAARFAAFRAEVANKIAANKVYSTTYNELQSLTNRDLADLGLGRSDIKRIALEAAYGK
ncbi:protein of unknown function [Yoonia tamlensis]|uniref:YjiS-like domain-containing protein n=1 Tax=Yoonia tamlensis TaxID=390270 RepID=A0A1I6G1A6_9RHOB|nr:DUF1127 domain-containing protein [Yoonia tamlensis]SFR35847.1 protein of unknown function [Yoonia tamlensis]